MLLLAITGCAPDTGETTGPFTRLHPDPSRVTPVTTVVAQATSVEDLGK